MSHGANAPSQPAHALHRLGAKGELAAAGGLAVSIHFSLIAPDGANDGNNVSLVLQLLLTRALEVQGSAAGVDVLEILVLDGVIVVVDLDLVIQILRHGSTGLQPQPRLPAHTPNGSVRPGVQ